MDYKKYFKTPEINTEFVEGDCVSQKGETSDFWHDYCSYYDKGTVKINKLEKPSVVIKKDEQGTEVTDMVNQPPHYTNGSIECIDALTAMIENWPDSNDAALSWQIVKYVWRHPYKGKSVEDLKKAQYYLNRLINYLENKN